MSQVWEWIIGGAARVALAIKGAAASIVGKVLQTFGLTLITLDAVLPRIKDFVLQQVAGLPQWALDFIAAVGVGEALSMIFSALTVRLAWKVMVVPTSVANQLEGGAS
jgi:hypothetical protein